MEAEAGGSCLLCLARWPFLFCTQVGVYCSHVSWVEKDPLPPFLSLFDLMLGRKGSQEEELVVEFP